MFSPIPEILDDIRTGKLVILVDDESRENEGDLVLAAQFATPEMINYMTRFAGGYLCLSLTERDCDRLDLHPQSSANTALRGTALTVSIDGHPRHGVGTGISASDRAKTIQLAIDPTTSPNDFVKPGHINPLRARDGGVLVRTGQTEGSVDLARLAGCTPAALIIEIVKEDGEMARRDDLETMCAEHGFKMCTIDQLIEYRLQREGLVRRLPPADGATITTEFGDFTLYAMRSAVDPLPHLVMSTGGVGALGPDGKPRHTDEPTLVRMHRRNLLGDIFAEIGEDATSSSCTLRTSMRMIQDEGRGAIVYLRPTGRGDSLSQRLITLAQNPALPEDAPDLISNEGIGAAAVPMHMREFGVGGQVLREIGLSKLRLITNHKKALPGLDAFGLEIVEHVPLA